MVDDEPSPLGGDPPAWEINEARRPPWETEPERPPWETVVRSDRDAFGQFAKGNPGRPKGIAPKAGPAARRLAARLAGIEPLPFLLRALGYCYSNILIEEAREKPSTRRLDRLYDRGVGYARDAAPYCHGKLATITNVAQLEGPPLDLRTLNDQQLDILILRLQRGTRRPIIDGAVAEVTEEEPRSD